MSKIYPLKNMIAVIESKKAMTSDSGIILERAKSAVTTSALVKAIGPDVDGISVGDEVYLDWSKGNISTVDGSQYVLISADHVACVIENT